MMHTRALILAAVLGGCTSVPPQVGVGPDVGKRAVAEHGMVAAGNPYASEAGVEMLRRGGNAVDAIVATAFALGVTEPMMSGVGAGGGMLYWNQRSHRAEYLDFYSAAGAVADTGLRAIRGSISPRATGVPGAVAGLLAAHAKYGALPRAVVMEPAIRLAAEGFFANSLLAREVLNDSAKVGRYEGARRIFLANGKPIRAGDRVVQPELATTLRAIAAGGADAFYRGEVAQHIVAVLHDAGNPITTDDFAAYAPRWERPLCTTYRGRAVLSATAPQSGMQVLEALNLLESRDIATLGLPSRSPEAFRVLTGALRVSVTDRDAYVGDSRFARLPQAGVVSKQFASARAAVVDSVVSGRLAPGKAGEYDAVPPTAACAPYDPMRTAKEPGISADAGTPSLSPESCILCSSETTHMVAVDNHGNAVSLTNTLGLGFGSGTWVDGVFLNSAMLNFSRNDSGPNAMGPRHIPSSTISPTLVLRDGSIEMVVGSPGSAAIPPAVVETIVYRLDYGLDPLAALRMPRVIPTSGTLLHMEDGFASEVWGEARRLGYEVVTTPPTDMSFGGVHVIVRDHGRWIGAADPRRDGEVRGY